MKTQSPDTSSEAEQTQIALLRRASAARHVSLTCALTQMVVQLSWRGIKRAYPSLDDRKTRLVSVALNYGQVLADNLSAALERMKIMNLPPNILTAVAPVIEAFERLGVTYFIGGSVASSVYGIPRSTMDVDLVANLRPEHVRPLVEQIQAAYYVDDQAVYEAVKRRSSFNLIHLDTMLKVDVFVPQARSFDAQLWRRIQREQLNEEDSAQVFWLPSPEDVILAKLEWYRLGSETSERQWADVLGILKVQAENLDTAYLRRWGATLQLVDLLERALTDTGLANSNTSAPP